MKMPLVAGTLITATFSFTRLAFGVVLLLVIGF